MSTADSKTLRVYYLCTIYSFKDLNLLISNAKDNCKIATSSDEKARFNTTFLEAIQARAILTKCCPIDFEMLARMFDAFYVDEKLLNAFIDRKQKEIEAETRNRTVSSDDLGSALTFYHAAIEARARRTAEAPTRRTASLRTYRLSELRARRANGNTLPVLQLCCYFTVDAVDTFIRYLERVHKYATTSKEEASIIARIDAYILAHDILTGFCPIDMDVIASMIDTFYLDKKLLNALIAYKQKEVDAMEQSRDVGAGMGVALAILNEATKAYGRLYGSEDEEPEQVRTFLTNYENTVLFNEYIDYVEQMGISVFDTQALNKAAAGMGITPELLIAAIEKRARRFVGGY